MVQDIVGSVTTTFGVNNEEVHEVVEEKINIVNAEAAHQPHHHGGSHDSCIQCLNYQIVPVDINQVSFFIFHGGTMYTPYIFSYLTPFYKTIRRPPKA